MRTVSVFRADTGGMHVTASLSEGRFVDVIFTRHARTAPYGFLVQAKIVRLDGGTDDMWDVLVPSYNDARCVYHAVLTCLYAIDIEPVELSMATIEEALR